MCLSATLWGTDPIAAVETVYSYSIMCSVTCICSCVSDPFAAVFGNESFGGGFADFSALTKVIKCYFSSSVLSPTHS